MMAIRLAVLDELMMAKPGVVGGALMMGIRLALQAALAGPPLSLTRVWARWRCSQRRSQRSGPSGWRRPSLEAC